MRKTLSSPPTSFGTTRMSRLENRTTPTHEEAEISTWPSMSHRTRSFASSPATARASAASGRSVMGGAHSTIAVPYSAGRPELALGYWSLPRGCVEPLGKGYAE